MATGFQVVNSSGAPVSGTWQFSADQSGRPASSIYPEVKGTTAYQVEFIPTETSEGQYGETLTQSVVPELSPKELHAVLTTPIEKNYDGRTDIALKATVEIGASGQSYTIRGLKGSFADANAGTGKAVAIDSSEARVETGESTVNLQNYRVVYLAQTTGTIRPIQGSVSIDLEAWTGEKTYGDDSFSLTGVKKVGDGALKYESSDEKVLTVDEQGQVTIKGTGSAEVSITMAEGTNYLGTNTPAKRTITIEKGTLTLALTAVNRSTGVQQPEGILGTYEDDFDIIASIQGAYGDKLQGKIRFYDNGIQNPDTIPVGEAGTAVLNQPKPGVASVGTHRMTAEFDFDTYDVWAAKYNTPAPAEYTFAIGPEGILRFLGGILPDLLSNDKVFSIFPQLKSCNIHNLLLDIEKVLCYNGQQVKKNRWKTRRKKIMKKGFALVMASMMALSLTACGGNGSSATTTADTSAADTKAEGTTAAAPADKIGLAGSGKELIFTTGGDQGTYYGFGSVLAGQISDMTDTTVTAIVGKGSKGNIEAMDAGDAQLGFVQSDVMAYAYNGTNLFDGAKVDGFSTVAALYMEQVQIVTLNPDIKTVADLKGKTVSVGDSGSGVYFNALDCLGAYGLTIDDITPTYQSFGDSVEAMQDGKIDAAFIVAGAPTTAVTSLAATRKVYLVELDDEHIDKLIEASPYYSKYTIAKDAYGLDADATTVAVGAVVVARDDVDENDIYNVVAGIYDSIDTLGHDKKNELDLDFAASVTAVPYHKGAAKYFAEKGLTVPTK